ncbi:MAG: hypothetical protein Q8P78_00780, partial [bacterium]|nr:hypothetical protein [bacterium]
PALYYGEQWKIHTVDLFGYFESSLRSQLKAKSLRAAEPVGGKIDFDKPGRLVGSWFREGTDYRGEGADCTYYECHLAFAYNHIDPNWVRISVPDSGIEESACNVCFGAFGVKGNGPDPATITPESGLVKYELVGRHDIENIDSNVLGTMLGEMLAPRRIKVEIFPGKTAGEAAAFTSAAHLYER